MQATPDVVAIPQTPPVTALRLQEIPIVGPLMVINVHFMPATGLTTGHSAPTVFLAPALGTMHVSDMRISLPTTHPKVIDPHGL